MKSPKQFSSRKEWEEFLWNRALDFILESKDKKDLKQKLESLFGKYERSLALRRLTTLLLLKESLSYKDIGRLLWISSTTISTIKKSFSENRGYSSRKERKRNSEKYISFKFEGFQKNKLSEFLDDLRDFLEVLLEGRNNLKKRWKFLSKYH